jgi:hypothetical protein
MNYISICIESRLLNLHRPIGMNVWVLNLLPEINKENVYFLLCPSQITREERHSKFKSRKRVLLLP